MLRAIQMRAHGNVSLNETLENMDLSDLEAYLFGTRHIDYPTFICEKLSEESLQNLEKEEICRIIERMRPTSLWKRNFEQYGSQESWEKRIADIHDTRNKVAHQKTISMEEFKRINSALNAINRDLKDAIEGIRKENFTEYDVVDILGSFATLVGELFIKSIEKSQEFMDVIMGFSAKIRKIAENMKDIFTGERVNVWNSLIYSLAGFRYETGQSELIEGLKSASLAFSSVPKEYLDSSRISLNDSRYCENIMKSIQLPQIEQNNKQETLENSDDSVFKNVNSMEEE